MKIPKRTASPLPWKLKARRTSGTKTLVCEIVDANGDIVVDKTLDEDGAVYADYRTIVEKVNGKQEPHRNN